jgi:polyphenol oxidase
MITQPLNGSALLRFDSLAPLPGLTHAVTTRPLNMACHCGPQAERAVERRRGVCEAIGVPFERLTCAEQVHGADVAVVNDTLAGSGREGRSSSVAGVDGLATDRPGVGLMVLSADCPLVLAFDPRRSAVGVAHASWRGTVRRMAQRLVECMVREFGCVPADLWAAIGPSAGPQAYVVGDEVVRCAAESLAGHQRYFHEVASGVTFDLWAANRDLLIDAGVRADQVELAGLCTIQDDRFFSYRREGATTGRFALVAGLRST